MPGPIRTVWLILLMAIPIALGLRNQRVGGDFAPAFLIGLIPVVFLWALGEVVAFGSGGGVGAKSPRQRRQARARPSGFLVEWQGHQHRPSRAGGKSRPAVRQRRVGALKLCRLQMPAARRPTAPLLHRYRRTKALPSSYPFLTDAGSCSSNCSGLEEATGAPSSRAVWHP
jgi:hypothetical protein